MKLKPYPEYRDSGLPWLGKIPAHWGFSSLRRLARVQLSNVDKHTVDGEVPVRLCNYTDVYYRNFISPDIEFMEASALPEEIEKFELRRDDVLITKDSESWTDIAVPAYVTTDMPGVLCGYHLAQIRPYSETLRGRYLFRAFQAEPIAYQFRVAANGVTRYGLSGGNIAAGLFPVPPEAEQDAITTFLDHADHLVDRLILAKQQLIGLLNEQKQVIIHRAVTRGLDPDAPMKPTGLDWLPEVPEHWDVMSVRQIATSLQTGPFGSQLHAHDYVPGGIPVINPSHLKAGRIAPDESSAVLESTAKRLSRHRLARGDIVLARRGELGRCALVGDQEVGWICGTGCLQLRPRKGIFDADYLLLALSSQGARDFLSLSSVGATMENLNATIVARLRIPYPPRAEQSKIIAHIAKESAHIGRAVDRARREIDLIREYRTRLISDVVTGKLDVRGVELPELDGGEEDVKVRSDGLESVVAEGSLDPEEVPDGAL